MGSRGPAPKPTRLKVLQGEKRPSRLRNEPQPDERPPQAPEWLTPEARKVWDRVVAELAGMQLAFAADADTIAAFCSSVALLARAERTLVEDGYLHDDANGNSRRSPWVLIRRDALAGIARFGLALGLSPAARARLGTPEALDEPGAAAAARLLS